MPSSSPASLPTPAIAETPAPPPKGFIDKAVSKIQSMVSYIGLEDKSATTPRLRRPISAPVTEPIEETTADQQMFEYAENHPSWFLSNFSQMDAPTLQGIAKNALGLLLTVGVVIGTGGAFPMAIANKIQMPVFQNLANMVMAGAAAGRVDMMMPGI